MLDHHELVWSQFTRCFHSLKFVGYSDFIHYSYSGGCLSPFIYVSESFAFANGINLLDDNLQLTYDQVSRSGFAIKSLSKMSMN